jgi:hypothetical protein
VLVSNTAVVTQKGFKKYRKQLVKLFAPFPYEYMNDAKVTPSEESKCKRAIEKAWADPSFGGARKVATIVDDAMRPRLDWPAVCFWFPPTTPSTV